MPKIIQSRIAVPGPSGSNGSNGAAGANGISAVANALLLSDANTTSVTPVALTGFSFAIGANEKWEGDFVIGTGCNNTGGIRFQVDGPSGCTGQLAGFGSAAAQNTLIANFTALGTLSPAFNTATFYNGFVRLKLAIQNAGTAGTISFKIAAGTAGQTATAYTNSSMQMIRVS